METSNSQRRTRWQVQFVRHQPRWVRPAGVSLFLGFGSRVEPSGQLSASNTIVLNQLNFGEQVAGSEASHLPIKLALR